MKKPAKPKPKLKPKPKNVAAPLTRDDPRIEMRDPADLVPYPKNSRTHSPKQIELIAKSIREFGFTSPILLADDGTIICCSSSSSSRYFDPSADYLG